jgi:hypothetical protein
MNSINYSSYSKLSLKLTNDLTKQNKKDGGIYFTPKSIIKKNIDLLTPYLHNVKNILEPSCGSCEYITMLKEYSDSFKITGIELNKTIYNEIKQLNSEKIKILNDDYLNHTTDIKYDLIIGNPPYYVMKKKDVGREYCDYFTGRPNIFSLFIIKSLWLLKPDGILSFILPVSFTNCLYYNNIRNYINIHCEIINIVNCDDDTYIDTNQGTLIFIIKKKTDYKSIEYDLIDDSCYTDINKTNNFVFNINNYTIFNYPSYILQLRNLYNNSTNLKSLGFNVCVGNVVWNQHKSILTDNINDTRLIYSSDIQNNELIQKKYKNEQKKNYIKKEGSNELVLVINRGYGMGNYKFEYCLINQNGKYCVENHLICIKYELDIQRPELLKLYKKIIKSLNDERTTEFIKLYFNNNAINTTELNNILPIYV